MKERFTTEKAVQKKKKERVTELYNDHCEQLLSSASEFCSGLEKRVKKSVAWLKRYNDYVKDVNHLP